MWCTSLVKMVYGFASQAGDKPTWHEMKHAIMRNFGGLENINPTEVFTRHMDFVDKGAKVTACYLIISSIIHLPLTILTLNHSHCFHGNEAMGQRTFPQTKQSLGILDRCILHFQEVLFHQYRDTIGTHGSYSRDV